MKKRILLWAALALTATTSVQAQSEIYPKHFNLNEVTLLDGPFKKSLELNNDMLLQYDVDRLLTPFVRESGLAATTDAASKYYKWTEKHPSFRNWGDNSFNLEGHVGGHYLSALALAYAATEDGAQRTALKDRMDYVIKVLMDCQQALSGDTNGMKGFLGGQPIREAWTTLYNGDTSIMHRRGGWVPFYCQHKVLAGLRDAYLYAGSKEAREMFRQMSDWAVELVGKVSAENMERMLNIEHGGMNESLADAYQMFSDAKYLEAAKKYSHKTMLNGMQTLNTTFLDGRHANTQVPKYIGFQRIGEQDATAADYLTAAANFWQDVATNRTVCIGGNSVNEHFLTVSNSSRYINFIDGPESCNSNNMMKLSEMLSDHTGDAKFVDFYEGTMLNHIFSTQDPVTGGYVYFTTLRPQGYRIYSQVNQGMWCCVGTGMENHSKYGHFTYTHDGKKTLYVNLFMASHLKSKDFDLKQETGYPYSQQTRMTVGKAGKYTIAVRHPEWTTDAYAVYVNGEKQQINVEAGKASYATVTRKWRKGDVITVDIPMTLRYEECPNYPDYIAFKYGPVLLGAQTTATSEAEAATNGLKYEALKNVYAGEGRMDHSPGVMGTNKPLNQAPLLIGNRADVLKRIKVKDVATMTFSIDASRPGVDSYQWTMLELKPFYGIHHARYMCYWYQQTAEQYANSDMAKIEAAKALMASRTIDFVAAGEQQSEAGHEYDYSTDSSKGTYQSETYRDAKVGGHIQYTLYNKKGVKEGLSIMCRFTTADKGRKATLTADGVVLAEITIPAKADNGEDNGFFNVEYPLPAALMVDAEGNARKQFVVRLQASDSTFCPGLYYLRLMQK